MLSSAVVIYLLLFYCSVVYCRCYASGIKLFYCSVVYRCCYESVIYCSTAVLSFVFMPLLSTVLLQCCLPLLLWICYLLFYFSVVYRCCYESVIFCSTAMLSTAVVIHLLSTVLLLLVLWIFYVFGVFAKNERGYRLTEKNNRFWSLLILLLSVASIRRKLLKSTYTEERMALQIQKVATFNSDRKKNQIIQKKSFKYYNQ